MRSDLVARVRDLRVVSGNTFVQSTGRWMSGVIVSALRRSIKSNHARMTSDFHRQGTAMYRLLFSQDERATPQQRRTLTLRSFLATLAPGFLPLALPTTERP